MRRHHALLSAAAAGVASLLLGACSTVQPEAATVNGRGIDRSAFEDDLEAYADNPAYIAQQTLQGQPPVVGSGSDTVTASFARGMLQSAIVYELVGQVAEERGVTVDDDVRTLAADLVQQTYAETLDGFPDDFVERRVDETAELIAVALDLADEEGLTAAQQERYDADVAAGNVRYGLRCVSHILAEDDAGAEEVLEDLEDGEDFGDVAEERSTDPSAATNRGELGCFGIEEQSLDANFLAGAFAAEVGEPTVVPTQFGVHVVLVTEIQPRSYEELSDVLLNEVLGSLGGPLNDHIGEVQANAEVSVDARYGRWDPVDGGIVDGEAGARPTLPPFGEG